MIATQDRTPAARPAAQAAMAAAALRDFQRRYPAYAGTAVLDDMRARDYARLDVAGHVYLDYTGGGLYAESQLARHRALLAGAVFGNPHSQNLSSRAMGARVEATRAQILEFFRASPEEYEVIFTPNATGALRLVGESYPFGPGSRFLLTFDNHNSVNGIRQFARARGASVSYVPLTTADLRVSRGGAGPPSPGRDPGSPPPSGRPALRPRRPQPVRFPGPVQLLRRPAPAGLDRPGPGGRVRRAAGRRRVRAGQPSWICPGGTRTTYPCRFTRSSGTRPASGPSWCASRRWPGCAARGTPAAPSPSPRSAPKRPPARAST